MLISVVKLTVVVVFFMTLFSVLVRHFCMNIRGVYIGKLKHFVSVISGFLCLDLADLVGLKPCTLGFFVQTRCFNALILVPRMSVNCRGRLMDEDEPV